jgi:hypothetical protein
MKVTVGTFNLNNLLSRFNFSGAKLSGKLLLSLFLFFDI